MVAILNTAILTAYGVYDYVPVTVEDAREMVTTQGYKSYVGHEATAQALSELLGVEVSVNREMYTQEVGDRALVFKLRGRLPEGKILSREELELIGYDLGLLVRVQ